MKTKILLFSLIMFLGNIAKAQDVTGDWNGVLKVGQSQLRLVFHITKAETGYTATMDSPDQGAKGIPMTKVTFENPKVVLELESAHINYTGTLVNPDSINGTFTQMGQVFPLNFTHKAIEKTETIRPQDPVKPYPYVSEDITFANPEAGITLAGTLTFPKKGGKYPAVVLITGSGPQNRNEEIMGHRPFLVLSDYLTRQGFAVLRFDDRGTYESKGNFAKATTFDFATDVESAVNYLRTRKEIDPAHIGLIGHSEGGIIAPIVASEDKKIDFIVLMAGTGIPGSKLLLLQQEAIGKASGMKEDDLEKMEIINKCIYQIVDSINDPSELKTKLAEFLKKEAKDIPGMEIPSGSNEDKIINQQVSLITSPWMLTFIRYNPATALEKVKCPVLAINGSKDLQVPADVNLPAIEKALKKGGNNKFTIKELPGLNHLFQECTTGLPKEYSEIQQTISPLALETMASWMKKTTGIK